MSPTPVLQSIDPIRFRAVMRHLPTGVAAICSTDPETGAPCGLIVGTFASLSLEPELATFSVARTSTSWSKVSGTGRFSVNLLADGQQSVCKALSRKEGDKFTASSGRCPSARPLTSRVPWAGSTASCVRRSTAVATC